MPILPHQARDVAESFGADAARYDRTRPSYPQALIDRIPGPDVLDVGIGTGIVARQLAGRRVLGVEVDARMAEVARRAGFAVEVAAFEDWQPRGRAFDAVVAGQTWHWIDPLRGAARAAEVLRPDGRLVLFWNVFAFPPELAHAFAAVYRKVAPELPFAGSALDAYTAILDNAADGIRATGAFTEPEPWRHDWERAYTRGEWLEQVPTFGGHSRLSPRQLDALLSGLAAALPDAFTLPYATIALSVARCPGAGPS
jgi:SAM-dependent methyltransferase